MDRLPNELLFEILLPLTYRQILKICNVNKRFNSICRDEDFWNRKSLRDVGLPLFIIRAVHRKRLKPDSTAVEVYIEGLYQVARLHFDSDITVSRRILELGFYDQDLINDALSFTDNID
jgi:hypothetical protein